jgi:hypothetical protein
MSEKKIWTLPPLRNFELVFFLSLTVAFGGSIGASFGWRDFMNGCCKDTIGTRSFVFIPWVVAFTLLTWTLFDIALKLRRIGAVAGAVDRFTSAYQVLYSNLTPWQDAAKSVIVNKTLVGEEFMLHEPEAVREAALALYAALALTLWEVCDGASESAAMATALRIMAPGVGVVATAPGGSVTVGAVAQIAEDFRRWRMQNAGSSTPLACVLIEAVLARIVQMGRRCSSAEHTFPYMAPADAAKVAGGAQMIMSQQVTESSIAALLDSARSLFASERNDRLWKGISVPVMVIGVLFPFLIPPIFYSAMGADIVYMGPLLCLCVTGAVLFNICMANPLHSPNSHHMDHVYMCLEGIAEMVDRNHATRFPVDAISVGRTDDAQNVRIAELLLRHEFPNFMHAAQAMLIPRPSALHQH